jgi:hypothetical protein
VLGGGQWSALHDHFNQRKEHLPQNLSVHLEETKNLLPCHGSSHDFLVAQFMA